jgi:hypothetical protein
MKKNQEEKLMITTGIIRWLRFPLLFIAVFMAVETMRFNPNWSYYLLVFLILTGLSYLLWNRRRLRHDSKFLYILRGKTETNVPLANIISIKRSRAKVNSSRYWILIYLDNVKEERKLRFDSDFNKPFFDAVRENNPEVVIWEHPFFNH